MANVTQTLAAMAVGAGAAATVDALPAANPIRFPIPGLTGVAIEPGATIGLGIMAALALTGKRGQNDAAGNGNLNLRSGAASLAGGMLVWEGGKLLNSQVLSKIPGLNPNQVAGLRGRRYVGALGVGAAAQPQHNPYGAASAYGQAPVPAYGARAGMSTF